MKETEMKKVGRHAFMCQKLVKCPFTNKQQAGTAVSGRAVAVDSHSGGPG
jgi:hypothetical protein